MNLLADWLRQHVPNVVVMPDWRWLISYEFQGARLLLSTCYENAVGAGDPPARAAAESFANTLETPRVDLTFGVDSRGTIQFSVNGGPRSPTALSAELEARFGPEVLAGGGAMKPVNVSAQVTSPFQLWQRQTFAPGLVAQDFDAWLSTDGPTALEFKQVKRIDTWMPYKDDAPNFRSLLTSMGPTSNLVVIAAPQGEIVQATTTVRPFLLSYRGAEKKAFKVPITSAGDLGPFFAAPFDLDTLEVLRSDEWKGRR